MEVHFAISAFWLAVMAIWLLGALGGIVYCLLFTKDPETQIFGSFASFFWPIAVPYLLCSSLYYKVTDKQRQSE